jgi:sulfur carrier protein
MKIKINGKDETVNGKKSIAELVSDRKLVPEHIVVEHNLRIVSKDQWHKTCLEENDSIEIVSFVGGG